MAIKCETDCREEILAKMDGFLPKSMLWKATLFIFMLWGIASAIYSSGLADRKEAIKSVTVAAFENTKNIAVIGRDLEHIRMTQIDTNAKLDMILQEARIEAKREPK